MKLSIKIILLIFSLSLGINNTNAQKLSKKELRLKAKKERKEREAKVALYRSYTLIAPSSKEIQKRFCSAIREHDMEKVKTYLDAGASINYFSGKYIGAGEKYYKYERFSEEKTFKGYGGKKVDGIDEFPDPLTIAVANNDLEMVDFLVKKGANPKFNTTLFTAVLNNDTSMISLLVKLGADIHFPTSNKYWWSGIDREPHGEIITPFEFAINKHKTIAYAYLSKMGEKPSKKFIENYIVDNSYRSNYVVWFVTYFLNNYEFNVNVTDEKHIYPPIYGALDYSRYEIIKLLIEKGANVNKTAGGTSPLMRAVIKKNNMKIVKLLVDSGADVNFKTYTTGFAKMYENKTILQGAKEEYKDYLIGKGAR